MCFLKLKIHRIKFYEIVCPVLAPAAAPRLRVATPVVWTGSTDVMTGAAEATGSLPSTGTSGADTSCFLL